MKPINPYKSITYLNEDNRVDIVTAPKEQMVLLRDLLLIIDLVSIPAVSLLPYQVDVLSEAVKTKGICLWSKNLGDSDYKLIDRLLAVNFVPSYRENLIQYLTNRDEFVLAPGGKLALSVSATNSGLLAAGDQLRIIGQGFQSIPYDPYASVRN